MHRKMEKNVLHVQPGIIVPVVKNIVVIPAESVMRKECPSSAFVGKDISV